MKNKNLINFDKFVSQFVDDNVIIIFLVELGC